MNIFESITAIQADVDFIGKEKMTQTGAKFKYRGVDQVLNTLHPLFAKHKVFAVPEVLEVILREDRETNGGSKVLYQILKVRYTFYAEDGSNVSAIVVGEAMDSGDKVSNKCLSVAYKYACFQILSIPTEETTQDPDDMNDTFALRNKNDETRKQGQEEKKENPNQLTREELKELGVTDFKGFAQWVQKQYEKSVLLLTESECDEIRDYLTVQKEKREKKAT